MLVQQHLHQLLPLHQVLHLHLVPNLPLLHCSRWRLLLVLHRICFIFLDLSWSRLGERNFSFGWVLGTQDLTGDNPHDAFWIIPNMLSLLDQPSCSRMIGLVFYRVVKLLLAFLFFHFLASGISFFIFISIYINFLFSSETLRWGRCLKVTLKTSAGTEQNSRDRILKSLIWQSVNLWRKSKFQKNPKILLNPCLNTKSLICQYENKRTKSKL